MMITSLSAFSILGLIILAMGLLRGQIVPKWASTLILIGSLFILVFMDLDNWMFLGSLLIFVGMLPISLKLLRNKFAELMYRSSDGDE